MRAYCDTSFLLSLAVEPDIHHAAARKVASRFTEPIPLTLLCESEMLHGLRRAMAQKILTSAEHGAIFRQFKDDVAEGIFDRPSLDESVNHLKGRELSKRYTPEMPGLRWADIFHVASARLLEVEHFASFDTRQRALANAEGMQLHPAKL